MITPVSIESDLIMVVWLMTSYIADCEKPAFVRAVFHYQSKVLPASITYRMDDHYYLWVFAHLHEPQPEDEAM